MRLLSLFLILLSMELGAQSLKYRAYMETYQAERSIPFFLEIKDSKEIWVYNAQDSIQLINIVQNGNRFTADFPVFNTQLSFHIGEEGNVLMGRFIDFDKEKSVAWIAKSVKDFKRRFAYTQSLQQIAPKWEFTFNPGEERERKGILELNLQGDHRIFSTLNTPMGDYRFLEGGFDGKKLSLSTFDGKFAYVFEAYLQADGSLKGLLFNPFSEPRPFVAQVNSRFELPNPYGMTKILSKEGINTKLTDLEGNAYPLGKEKYKGKVTLIQIGGTWCPNCLDESLLLSEWHRKYQSRGLEVVGIFFELKNNNEWALPRINKLKKDLDIPYTLLLGGDTKPETLKSVLPMIEQLRAYPTLLIFDKNYSLVKVHTGFSGPSTSGYEDYKKEMERFIEELLKK